MSDRDELILEGRVVIVQSDTDPSDMGEPRMVQGNEGEWLVFVPSFDFWVDTGPCGECGTGEVRCRVYRQLQEKVCCPDCTHGEEERLAAALDGMMADYLVANPAQAFGWWAAPRVLERVKAADLRGMAPGLTGGLGSEEYVRRIRDELEDRIQTDRRSWPTRVHDGAYQRVLDIIRSVGQEGANGQEAGQ